MAAELKNGTVIPLKDEVINIISTNNLIMYGLLYKKLSPALSEMLLGSSVVKEFNRKNDLDESFYDDSKRVSFLFPNLGFLICT